MKFSATLLIICIIGQSLADPMQLAQILAQNTEYQKIVADTVNLQIKMGQSVHSIIDMLKGMKRDIEQQKSDAYDRYFWEMNKCHDDTDALEDLIYRSQFDVGKFKTLIELDEDIHEDRTAELVRKQQELANIEGFIAKFAEERELERQKYLAAQQEHEAVRHVIMQCKTIMEERLTAREGEEAAPGNFLEKPNAFVAITTVLDGFQPTGNGPAAHFNQILLVLRKMVERAPVQADQDIVSSIVRILDDLLENLDNSWDIEQEAERQRKAAFEENDEYVQATKDKVVGQISSLTQEITALERRLLDQREHLSMQEDNFANGDQNLRDQRAECQQIKNAYDTQKTSYEEQIRVLRETIYVLEEHIDVLVSENAATYAG